MSAGEIVALLIILALAGAAIWYTVGGHVKVKDAGVNSGGQAGPVTMGNGAPIVNPLAQPGGVGIYASGGYDVDAARRRRATGG